jgi:hypothetical protein
MSTIPGDAAPIDNPAMPEDQFWYDENRRVREQAISNPEILAQTVLILSDKVAQLEEDITWLKSLQSQTQLKTRLMAGSKRLPL